MLLEHINHYNNLHFSLQFSNVSQEAPHYHKEMELVLMLRGYARYKVHHQDYHINAGDIFVVDTQDLHHIYESSEDVIMLQFHVDMAYFADIYPNIDVMFFVCEETDHASAGWHQRFHNKIAFLSHHIAEMMMLCQNSGNDKILEEKLREFLYIMVDKFQAFYIENNEFHLGKEDIDPLDLERLYRIMHYLYANFDKKISLSDIAAREHLSIHYVSHFIKKTSGLSFQNLLNYIRVEQAERLLNENRLNLTQISAFCGFSSPAYFNKCFASWHNMTPSDYRKQWKPRQRSCHGNINNIDALLLLQSYLNTDLPDVGELEGGYSINHLVIPINAHDTATKDFKRIFPVNILIDDAASLVKSAYYINELTDLHPDKLRITESAVLDAEHADHIISHLQKNGFKPEFTDKQAEHDIRNHPATTTAAAFVEIINTPEAFIKLFDDSCGLLTSKGLPAPYFTAYTAFNKIDGVITAQHQKYILVNNTNTSTLLIHNHNGTSDLNIHVQFDPSSCPEIFVQQTFASEANIYDAPALPDTSEHIHQNLKNHLWSFTKERTKFIAKEELKHFRLNITVKPDAAIILYMY